MDFFEFSTEFLWVCRKGFSGEISGTISEGIPDELAEEMCKGLKNLNFPELIKALLKPIKTLSKENQRDLDKILVEWFLWELKNKHLYKNRIYDKSSINDLVKLKKKWWNGKNILKSPLSNSGMYFRKNLKTISWEIPEATAVKVRMPRKNAKKSCVTP